MDEDLEAMGREQLDAEVRKLRDGIRADSQRTGHDLCWHRPELWSLVPDYVAPSPDVPRREEFIQQCELYRDSFDPPLPNGPRLESVLGMHEMEAAASRIIEKRERYDIPLLCRVTVTWDAMRGRFEQHGFLNLLLHGWLEPNYVNFSAHGEFFPNEELVKRLAEKLGPQPWLEWRPQVELKKGDAMVNAVIDAKIRDLTGEANRLKRERMSELSACGFCDGTGDTGTEALRSVCSVCRGLKVDMGELTELRKGWGELA